MKNRYWIVLSAVLMLSAFDTTVAQEDGTSSVKNERHQNERHRDHRGMRGYGFGDPSRTLKMMSRHLDLDDNQQQAISNILDAAKPELDALSESTSANRDAIRGLAVDDADYGTQLQNLSTKSGELAAQAVLLRGKIRADVHAVLTPEQLQQLADRGEKTRGHFRQRRGSNQVN